MDPMVGEAARLASGTGLVPDTWPVWNALNNVPVLAIRGEHSDILSIATFARMAREKPGLERLIVANRGHAPTLDEPACRQAIDQFLSRLA